MKKLAVVWAALGLLLVSASQGALAAGGTALLKEPLPELPNSVILTSTDAAPGEVGDVGS